MKSFWCIVIKALYIWLIPLHLIKIKCPEILQIWSSFTSYDYHIIPHQARSVICPSYWDLTLLLVCNFRQSNFFGIWSSRCLFKIYFESVIKSLFLGLSSTEYIYSAVRINLEQYLRIMLWIKHSCVVRST
jgi:hypothetical protein